jgi:2-polyprenyl-6-methoxyphenol hydroxylase-like FAD-dependent oxidoreductase
MTAQSQRRAIVIGGSVAGLFAAHYLRRAGWQADVFERTATPLSGRGAGIMTHPGIRAALEALGLESKRDFGVPIETRVVVDAADKVVASYDYPQIATSWNRVFELLFEAFPAGHYHRGKDLAGIDQTADQVTARFADGSAATGELLIGADGFRSTVRMWLMPDVQPEYAGYVAWRGLMREAQFADLPDRDRFELFTFCLPPGEQMLGYPVAGLDNDVRPGHRGYSFVWYVPADESTEVPQLLTDLNGKRHTLSIPPPLIAPRAIADMRRHAEGVGSPWFRMVTARLEQPFLQPIYDLVVPCMAVGRVALTGDAAFVIRPHVGAGVLKAAEDAASLASSLAVSDDVASALAAYSAARTRIGHRIVAHARQLGVYLKRSFMDEAERRLAAQAGAPMSVLRETAVLDFLRD